MRIFEEKNNIFIYIRWISSEFIIIPNNLLRYPDDGSAIFCMDPRRGLLCSIQYDKCFSAFIDNIWQKPKKKKNVSELFSTEE